MGTLWATQAELNYLTLWHLNKMADILQVELSKVFSGMKMFELQFNTLRPRRNEQHFADDIFKHIFFNENVWILIKISLKFVPKGPINNIPTLVQIMAWRRPGDKPLSGPMRVILLMHISVTRPQWVKFMWILFPIYWINKKATLIQIMNWHWTSNNPLHEPVINCQPTLCLLQWSSMT